MKIVIDDKIVNVEFWSFLKCNLLTSLTMFGVVLTLSFMLSILFGI